MRIKSDKSEGAASSSTSPEISGHPSKSFSEALERSKRETEQPPFPSREQAVQTLRERIRLKASAPKEMEGESNEEMPSSSSRASREPPPTLSRPPSPSREPPPSSIEGESDEETPSSSSRASREPPPSLSRAPSPSREPPSSSSTRSSQGSSREPPVQSKSEQPSLHKAPPTKDQKGNQQVAPPQGKTNTKDQQPIVHAKAVKTEQPVIPTKKVTQPVVPSDTPMVKKQKSPEQPAKPVVAAAQAVPPKKEKELTPSRATVSNQEAKIVTGTKVLPQEGAKTLSQKGNKALPQEGAKAPEDSEVEEAGAVSSLGEGDLKKKQELLHTTSQSKVEEVQRSQSQVQIQAIQGAMLGQAEAAQASAPTAGASPVDQIVAIMQNNQFFGAPVQQITVAKTVNETTVSVALQNGVRVSLAIAAGGKDVNITIHGISAQAQAAIDNPANRLALNEKLASQGFTVHQMQTFRSDTPQPPPGQQAFRGYEREGGGQQQRQKQEEPEAPESVEGEE